MQLIPIMINILLDQVLSDSILEILETGPSELTIVMQSEAEWGHITRLIEKINNNRMLFYPSYTIYYVYDNGRLIEKG